MKRRGFTLVEVLIAVAILTMISTLLFTSFSSLKRSKDGVRRVSERYREGRMAISRVSRELESAYISKHLPLDLSLLVVQTAFQGRQGAPADRIDFNAFVHRRMDRDSKESDQAEISYYGAESPYETGTTDLVRRINPRIGREPGQGLGRQPAGGGRAQVVATDIDLFDLKYLDPLTATWVDEWDTTEAIRQYDRLPLQVKITLVLNGGAREGSDRGHATIPFVSKVVLPIQQPLTFALQ